MEGKLVTENIGVPKGRLLGQGIPRTRVALPGLHPVMAISAVKYVTAFAVISLVGPIIPGL